MLLPESSLPLLEVGVLVRVSDDSAAFDDRNALISITRAITRGNHRFAFQDGGSLLAGGYWGLHRGKPVPFANRAPSWIFEARAPGYERVAQKSREGEGEGREKPPA